MISSRRLAREWALKILYQADVGKMSIEESLAAALERLRMDFVQRASRAAVGSLIEEAFVDAVTAHLFDVLPRYGACLELGLRDCFAQIFDAAGFWHRADIEFAFSRQSFNALWEAPRTSQAVVLPAEYGALPASVLANPGLTAEDRSRLLEFLTWARFALPGAALRAFGRETQRLRPEGAKLRETQDYVGQRWRQFTDSMAERWGAAGRAVEKHACDWLRVTAFARLLVEGVSANQAELDGLLRGREIGWAMDRQVSVDRNILRMAAYELAYLRDIPASATINEAVELAKKYSTAELGKFVNGVLGAIVASSTGLPVFASPNSAADELERAAGRGRGRRRGGGGTSAGTRLRFLTFRLAKMSIGRGTGEEGSDKRMSDTHAAEAAAENCAILLDGIATAKVIRAEIAKGVRAHKEATGFAPHLAAVLIGADPASETYVSMKQKACGWVGMDLSVHRLPADATQEEAEALVEGLNADAAVSGILVQHPLPKHLHEPAVLDRVSAEKDIDGISRMSLGGLINGEPAFPSCTPAGIIELLDRYGIPIEGREAVVVGRSIILGKPVAMMLLNRNATVTICHSRTADLGATTRRADILVAAVGRAELIGAEMVKPGAVVIDAGYNRVAGRSGDVGDVAFDAVRQVASHITPVPGGVGPMTIAMLLRNTLRAADQRAART